MLVPPQCSSFYWSRSLSELSRLKVMIHLFFPVSEAIKRKARDYPQHQFNLAEEWLLEYANKYANYWAMPPLLQLTFELSPSRFGEKMPNSMHIHICGCTWAQLYGMMCKDLMERRSLKYVELPSVATFSDVRKAHPYIKRPKKVGMGKCSVCQRFRKK